MKLRLPLVAAALLSAVVAWAGGPVASAGGKPQVLLVCNGTVPCPHTSAAMYKTLGSAVAHAHNGDWILIWPGRYKEGVEVQQGHGLTNGLHIRGMNRNGVVFDGTKTGGSAVHVKGVNNTWVENMTGEHYHTGSANAFYWTGVDGYWGNYLTAYDNGDYGVYAYDSTCSGKAPCVFAFDYGSWNADSGIYIGGCRDCHAVITNSRAYKNAIGYSGTNAGGELYVMNSEWDHNGSGLVPNTLTSEPDAPQSGGFFVGNYIHDNNDHDVPGAGITAIAPVGYGLDLAGAQDNVVRDNLIKNEMHGGVVAHWLFTPAINNQVLYNTFVNVGYAGGPSDADIVFDATGIQNCTYGNIDRTGGHTKPATESPGDLTGAHLTSCGDDNPGRQNGKGIYQPGNPLADIAVALNSLGITEPKDFKGAGPHPEAQMTMPNPCRGVPDNAWCQGGRLVFDPPSKAPKA
jgi:hypothetical protein